MNCPLHGKPLGPLPGKGTAHWKCREAWEETWESQSISPPGRAGSCCGLGAAVSKGLSHVEEFSLVKFSPQHRVGPWSIQDTGIVFGFVSTLHEKAGLNLGQTCASQALLLPQSLAADVQNFYIFALIQEHSLLLLLQGV